MNQLRTRLVGVVLERQLEPSHELLEAMMQQKEMNQLNYISLERCSSREWEITMGKNKKQLALDAEKLTIREKSDVPDQFHGSELQAIEALRRRGAAMAFADIISWEQREKYLQQLTSHLRTDPPPNYSRPTLPQLLKADRQVFLYLIRTGVELKRLPSGLLDMDEKIMRALESYEVGFHLLPLPKTGSKAETTQTSSSSQSTSASKWQGVKGDWNQGSRWQPYKGKGGKSSKGKGKGGKNMGQGILPKVLLGRDNISSDPHGRRLCFDYQQGKCTAAPDGGECPKGWHFCCRRGCYAPHAEKDHDAKSK